MERGRRRGREWEKHCGVRALPQRYFSPFLSPAPGTGARQTVTGGQISLILRCGAHSPSLRGRDLRSHCHLNATWQLPLLPLLLPCCCLVLQSVGCKDVEVLPCSYCRSWSLVTVLSWLWVWKLLLQLLTVWVLQIQKLRHRETEQLAQGNRKSVGDLGIDPRCPEFSVLTTRPSFLSLW